MKYAQFLTGMFAGIAIGGSVVASTDGGSVVSAGNGGVNAEAVRNIVREVIAKEPKLILESVEKYHRGESTREKEAANESLKDKDARARIFSDVGVGSVGPKDSKRVIVEFFDYNCPACKMQFKEINALVKRDPSVRVLFREYPIFGPVSENNSRLGIAIAHLAPEKYFAYYEKMHSVQGRAGEKDALGFIRELGLDVEKIQAESKTPAVEKALEENRNLGDLLNIRGTPTMVVGDDVVPHAVEAQEIINRLNKK